ncbi:YD repeat-containing protein [Chitinophaga terrae (ex Kim and Jung 2007)]|uniref:RHS repeat domain-containing protein n=1 Tax=Chitinophaga terrae (ex Kim and Jung 2007) TaxID=408074 RepID=UPI00278623CC|nr:RHS repeat domain-containing protein [Chitinophaga terrae (ex Kim and Jung 2007)]MDQ0110239.1 YD repeat-containing protein [Chitinophaga terrae (ex Kim and Jung 2007)]
MGNLANAAPRHWGRFNAPPAEGGGSGVAAAETQASPILPKHGLVTAYAYNSLNQVTLQKSPDAGGNSFWYDRLGRLVASQNSQQKASGNKYSYTKYDALGRIVEVGEKTGAAALPAPFFLENSSAASFLGSGVNTQITRTCRMSRSLGSLICRRTYVNGWLRLLFRNRTA